MGVTVTSGVEAWLEDEERRKISLGYCAFSKQREFHECGAKYRLFGGAAGPGKSKALLMEAIAQATETPGANTLLLRRTFPELEGSLLLYFRRDVPRECYRSFNEAKHTVTWHNGSTTRFGYSQSENDIYQYQSSEFLFIGIDELTHFTLRQWQFLTSRNRCPVARARPCMAGATNPGNIGHAWVKSLFIDKQPAAGMEPREYDANDYAFIPARVTDNPIYANDSGYLKTLQQLPDFYRRAFLDGDWSVFAGQYFSNFDPSQSVIRAEQIGAETWWPRWISIDWGFEHPAAVYWHVLEAGRPRLEAGAARGSGRNGLTSVPIESIGTGRELQNYSQFYEEAGRASRGSDAPAFPQRYFVDGPSHETRPASRVPQWPPNADLPAFGVEADAAAPTSRVQMDAENRIAGLTHELPASRFENGRGEPRPYEKAALRPHERAASRFTDAAAPTSRVQMDAENRIAGLTHGLPASRFEKGRGEPRPYEKAALRPHERAASRATDAAAPTLYRATTITYREFIEQHLAPRVLAAQIIERSRLRTGATEKIEAIYLSPDAFARRTDESSIAEQMGEILQAAGLPRT